MGVQKVFVRLQGALAGSQLVGERFAEGEGRQVRGKDQEAGLRQLVGMKDIDDKAGTRETPEDHL